jgi:hypothetical protein
MTETLIIFSRYPEAGKTKTRMIPALGADGAAQLQREMTEHTVKTGRELSKSHNISIEIHFTGCDRELMEQWLGKDFNYYPQVTGDLGIKMRSAFEEAFNNNSQRVVIIGIDCPDIHISILNEAFNALEKQDLVLGEAEDGGYYLIGLNHLIAELFQNINWGSSEVFNRTKNIANQLNLNIHYLPILRDIDRPEDLLIWQKYQNKST